MTQEEKELLLKDLCARLPYGVVYHRKDGANIKLNAIDVERGLLNYTDDIEERECKPYLCLMSSMTEEEESRYNLIQGLSHLDQHWTANDGKVYRYADAIDFLNAHHFDYRGLIEKGLALKAPEGMYNLK